MNQEFIIGPIKIEQDEHGYGVSVLVNDNPVTYEVRANFKDALDMLVYAQQIAVSIEQQRQMMDYQQPNQEDGEE